MSPAEASERQAGAPPLRHGAIGFLDGLVIAFASAAPAYSLAAALGALVAAVGAQAPAALLVSFVPMLLVASAFHQLNRAEPDCGATFTWVTRAMGPALGWVAGWAVCATGILVIGSLAEIASRYSLLLVGLEEAARSAAAVVALAVACMVAMTALCVYGTEASARLQRALLVVQAGGLGLFAVAALAAAIGGGAPTGARAPSLSWVSPFAVESTGALVGGLLIGVFIYWGWESALNLNEETANGERASGRAGVASTVVLLATYLLVTVAVVSYAGTGRLGAIAADEGFFGTLAGELLVSPLDKLVLLALVASALASTQTTVLPGSRTALSMARAGALPAVLARVHPRFRTPHVATVAIGVLAVLWYVPVRLLSESFLADSITALALLIAFYYALTGYACPILYRRRLRRSARDLVRLGLAPLLGALCLTFVFVRALVLYADPAESELGQSWLGLGVPAVLGLGLLLLGGLLMAGLRAARPAGFFSRRAEALPG